MVKINRIVLSATVAAATLLLGGCADRVKTADGGYQDPFFPPEYTRLHDRVGDAQAAEAARQDPTLYPHHFNGDALNSLGEQKLSLIMSGSGPVVVYLNMAEDAASGRAEAVKSFASAGGGSVEVKTGANPGVKSPTGSHLRHMVKTETGTAGTTSASGGAGDQPMTTGN